MTKYSLSDEVIASIDLIDDSALFAEMSVLDAMLDTFEKAVGIITEMKSDQNLENFSIIQEACFFLEADDAKDTSKTDTPPENMKEGSKAEDKKKAEKSEDEKLKNMTEEERKKYNEEHWVRRVNKEGKKENIFISIIAFIPRCIGALVRAIRNAIKKHKGKKTKEDTKAVANAPEEAKKELEEVLAADETVSEETKNKIKEVVNGKYVHTYSIKAAQSIAEDIDALLDELHVETFASDKPSNSNTIFVTKCKKVGLKLAELNKKQDYETPIEEYEAATSDLDARFEAVIKKCNQKIKDFDEWREKHRFDEDIDTSVYNEKLNMAKNLQAVVKSMTVTIGRVDAEYLGFVKAINEACDRLDVGSKKGGFFKNPFRRSKK